MKKRTKIFVIVAVILVVIIVGIFIAYDKITSGVADMVLRETIKNQLNSMLDSGQISLDSLKNNNTDNNGNTAKDELTPDNSEGVLQNGEPSNGDSSPTASDSKPADSNAQMPQAGNPQAQAPQTENPQANTPSKEQPDTEGSAIPSDSKKPSQPSENSPASQNTPEVDVDDKAQLISDKVDKIVDSISAKTKKELIAMITSKLTANEIAYFLSLLSNGLTPAERKEGKTFVYGRFSPDEIATIQGLYDKYIDELEAELAQK